MVALSPPFFFGAYLAENKLFRFMTFCVLLGTGSLDSGAAQLIGGAVLSGLELRAAVYKVHAGRVRSIYDVSTGFDLRCVEQGSTECVSS